MAPTIAQLSPTALEAFQGHHILIIGGTAGLGKALAIAALSRGARVTVVGRRDPGPELASATFVKRDLSSMKNAAALADDLDTNSFDTIVFTNGIFATKERHATPEGVEVDLAVSYLSRFVFARRLVEKGFGAGKTDQTRKPRIFVMGYPGGSNKLTLNDFNSESNYQALTAHINTVVANEALVTYLNRELKGNVNVYGLNPGLIRTEIRDNFLGKGTWLSWFVEGLIGLFTPTPEAYAENSLVHIVLSPELEDKPGTHVGQSRQIVAPNTFLAEEGVTDRIIAESAKLADSALASSA